MQGAWTGVFRGTGVRLCTILDMNFREYLFHAVNKGKKHLILIQSPILVWNTPGKWYEKKEEAESVVDR